MRDEEIVNLYWERQEQALKETEEKYGKYCTYIARNILGNDADADECRNDVLAAAWNSIPPKKPENLKTYLGKIARRIAVSRWREEHAEKRCPSEFSVSLEEISEVATDDDFVSQMEQAELTAAINRFLRSLPVTKRNLFIRRYWFNESIKCIADKFGFSEGKVKVTLQRTREKLKEYLQKEGLLT